MDYKGLAYKIALCPFFVFYSLETVPDVFRREKRDFHQDNLSFVCSTKLG